MRVRFLTFWKPKRAHSATIKAPLAPSWFMYKKHNDSLLTASMLLQLRKHQQRASARHTLPLRGCQTRPKPFHSSRPCEKVFLQCGCWTRARTYKNRTFPARACCCQNIHLVRRFPPLWRQPETDPGANSYAVVRLIVSWSWRVCVQNAD